MTDHTALIAEASKPLAAAVKRACADGYSVVFLPLKAGEFRDGELPFKAQVIEREKVAL